MHIVILDRVHALFIASNWVTDLYVDIFLLLYSSADLPFHLLGLLHVPILCMIMVTAVFRHMVKIQIYLLSFSEVESMRKQTIVLRLTIAINRVVIAACFSTYINSSYSLSPIQTRPFHYFLCGSHPFNPPVYLVIQTLN